MVRSHVRAFILGHKTDRSDGRHAPDSRILQWLMNGEVTTRIRSTTIHEQRLSHDSC
jgi:hypothetical protein